MLPRSPRGHRSEAQHPAPAHLFKLLISFTRKKQFRVSFRLREEGGIWGTASAAFAVGFYLGEGAGKVREGEAMVSAGLSVAGISDCCTVTMLSL